VLSRSTTSPSGAKETAAEAEATRKAKGDDVGHGIGNALGGAKDILGGNILSGGKRILNGIGESGGAVVNKIGGFLSSINPFEEGTSEIQKGGLALLHQGEAVIPASTWEKMSSTIAQGDKFNKTGSSSVTNTGAFDKGSSSEAMSAAQDREVYQALMSVAQSSFNNGTLSNEMGNKMSKMMEAVLGEKRSGDQNKAIHNAIMELAGGKGMLSDSSADKLLSHIEDIMTSKGTSSVKNTGAFDKGSAAEAMSSNSVLSSIMDNVKAASELLSSTEKITTSVINSGLFESGNVGDALEESLSGKESTISRSILAEVSRALDYETSASDSATKVVGQVNTNPLDYTDDIKGQANTLGLSRAVMETNLEQERAGSMSSSSVLVPSMDLIGEYLVNDQAQKLDQMIALLTSIDGKVGKRSGSDIIGAISGGNPPIQRPGVKSIAHDKTRGHWDLTYGDSSPGSITTEGRGGSA
jgi:hypothetical protein